MASIRLGTSSPTQCCCLAASRHAEELELSTGKPHLDLEEQFGDVLGEFFGLLELAGTIAEGLLDGKLVVIGDVEGEVAGFAIEGRVAGDSEAFGVVEHDGRVVMRDARVEPGETAACDCHFVALAGLSVAARELQGRTRDGGFGRGDVALQLALDLIDVFFEAKNEVGEEWFALFGDDAIFVLVTAELFRGFVAFVFDILCEICNPLFAHACNSSCIRVASSTLRSG
jgi:hypothetical protein